MKAKTKKLLLMLMLPALAILTGCSLTKPTVIKLPSGVQVNEAIGKQGYYLQFDAISHTAPGLNDTALIAVIGPDSVVNNVWIDVKNYISTKILNDRLYQPKKK